MLKQVVEVLWVSRFDYDKGNSLQLHRHKYYQIIYILEGQGHFFLSGTWHQIERQGVFLMKPDDEHGLRTDSNIKLKTLDIKFLVKDHELEETLGNLPGHSISYNAEIAALLENIRHEGLQRKDLFQEFSCLYLLEILLKLVRLEEKPDTGMSCKGILLPNEPASAYEHIKEYIEGNFMEEVNLTAISRALGYNKSYICQVFKKYARSSVMNFLYDFRIERSKELLIYSDYCNKEIAAMTGFKTVHHFNRRFHTKEGVAPGEFRQRERSGIRKDIIISEGFSPAIQFTHNEE